MKAFIKIICLVIVVFLLSVSIIAAQETSNTETSSKSVRAFLTAEQKAELKLNREKQIEFRNQFRETLSENQLGILTDPRLTREAKISSLRASLSDNQVNLIKSNRKQIRTGNVAFKNTLTEQQRLRIRRMAISRAQQNRAVHFRARLKNRLKRI